MRPKKPFQLVNTDDENFFANLSFRWELFFRFHWELLQGGGVCTAVREADVTAHYIAPRVLREPPQFEIKKYIFDGKTASPEVAQNK